MRSSDSTGRTKSAPRHVRLYEHLMASEAWRSLDTVPRALYVEILRRYRGLGSNNGRIPFSAREAAAILKIGKSTANRAFFELSEKGFIVVGQQAAFNMKQRKATEWLVTEFPDDRVTGQLARKDFMRWTGTVDSHTSDPSNLKLGATTDRDSPISGPRVALRRDTVA